MLMLRAEFGQILNFLIRFVAILFATFMFQNLFLNKISALGQLTFSSYEPLKHLAIKNPDEKKINAEVLSS